MDARKSLPLGPAIKQRLGWILGAAAVVAACVAIRNYAPPEAASAKAPQLPEKPAAARPKTATTGAPAPAFPEQQKLSVVAAVNGAQISREDLGRECLLHYGTEVLESLVNKQLIAEHCQQRKISVSEQEIQAEIDRMSRKFNLPKDQWMKLLEKERGIKPAQYASDIVWPTLALKKLAADELKVTPKEVEEAYQSQFGPGVKVRLIAMRSRSEVEKVHAQAVARPDEFGALARKHSQDVNSASANGLIQPIRRGLGDKNLETVAFGLKPGDISPVIQVGELYTFLKCEDRIPPASVDRAHVDPILQEAIRDRKLRTAGSKVFQNLQSKATIENILNDPKKQPQMPGVAAIVNGRKITIRELQEECIARHGGDVLEGAINHKLIEQALSKRKLAVTDADLYAEVARAAIAMGKTDKSGKADIDAWIKTVTEQQKISEEVYLHDAVWPSVALKKLVGDSVQISENDLLKGFEANYGKRVRCRAIMCANQRKAQEVWDLARRNPTVENFGKLAEQYSIEANSRALRGEMPPIQKHGGQPVLEDQAFSLQPGELSGIIQLGQNFVILLCEGFTQPTKVEYKEVRQLIYEDLHEKKQRLAMSKEFDQLKDNSTVDNYLAGTMHTPKRAQAVADQKLLGPKAPLRK